MTREPSLPGHFAFAATLFGTCNHDDAIVNVVKHADSSPAGGVRQAAGRIRL
jgi:hypothetical protein